MRTVVIGIDGGSFEIIEPWLEECELPNFKKIMEGGCYADMDVCLPPVTAPNWKCYSTGKNPGELGIFWWRNIDVKSHRIRFPEERKFEHKEIWDYLNEEGYRTGIIGMPMTYPARDVKGFMISGGPDAQHTEKAFYNVEKNINYKIKPETHINVEKDKSVREILDIIENNFQIALKLFEERNVDFLHFTCFNINLLQHFLWNEEPTKKAWKIVDKYLGKILEKKDVNLLVMSDHGSNEIKTIFNINTWLEEKSYLKTKKNIFQKLGITGERILSITNKLGIDRFLRRIIPERIIRKIPSTKGEVEKEGKEDIIDWNRSKAIGTGQGLVYLIDKNYKDEIKNKLENLKDDKDNPVAKKVYEAEEIYSGKYMGEAPDLIIDQAKGVRIPDGVGKKQTFEHHQKKWKAENKSTGFFLAHGPKIKNIGKIDNVQILDLAPTVFQTFNMKRNEKLDIFVD